MAREVYEVRTLGGRVRYIEGPCDHADASPVHSGGSLVAWLCTDCDTQLPAGWRKAEVDG